MVKKSSASKSVSKVRNGVTDLVQQIQKVSKKSRERKIKLVAIEKELSENKKECNFLRTNWFSTKEDLRKANESMSSLKKENFRLKNSIFHFRPRNEVDDLKISHLKATINDLKKQLETVKNAKPAQAVLTESQKKAIKLGETQISINNDTVQRARKSILNGKSMSRMKSGTKLQIVKAGLWDDFQMLERKVQQNNSKNPLRGQMSIKIV